MTKMKKMIASAALATTMAASAIIPASAAVLTVNFTSSGNIVGVTTTCSGFGSYVTAHAKVTTNGVSTTRQSRGYKYARVSASRYFVSGSLTRSGWYTL